MQNNARSNNKADPILFLCPDLLKLNVQAKPQVSELDSSFTLLNNNESKQACVLFVMRILEGNDSSHLCSDNTSTSYEFLKKTIQVCERQGMKMDIDHIIQQAKDCILRQQSKLGFFNQGYTIVPALEAKALALRISLKNPSPEASAAPQPMT